MMWVGIDDGDVCVIFWWNGGCTNRVPVNAYKSEDKLYKSIITTVTSTMGFLSFHFFTFLFCINTQATKKKKEKKKYIQHRAATP